MQKIGTLLCCLGLFFAQEAIAHQRPTKAAAPRVTRALVAGAVAPSATLAWDYGGTQQSGFQASRCMATSPAMECTNDVGITGPLTPSTLRQWTDTPLVEGKHYCWRVRAIWADGTASDWSNRACYTVPVSVPPPVSIPPPTNLRVMGP